MSAFAQGSFAALPSCYLFAPIHNVHSLLWHYAKSGLTNWCVSRLRFVVLSFVVKRRARVRPHRLSGESFTPVPHPCYAPSVGNNFVVDPCPCRDSELVPPSTQFLCFVRARSGRPVVQSRANPPSLSDGFVVGARGGGRRGASLGLGSMCVCAELRAGLFVGGPRPNCWPKAWLRAPREATMTCRGFS